MPLLGGSGGEVCGTGGGFGEIEFLFPGEVLEPSLIMPPILRVIP